MSDIQTPQEKDEGWFRDQTPSEEFANSLIHGAGFLISLAGLSILVVFAALKGTVWHVVSCSIYGATLAILYLSSTLYHGLRPSKAKKVFNVIDHSSIYLLVAGTYTPFALGPLRQHGGWILFGLIWGFAIFGVIFQSLFIHRFPVFSVLTYITAGWLIIFSIKPLLSTLPLPGIIWLAAGGLCYTGGVIFYAVTRPFFHAVWHLFVLAGSLCHFISVLLYVIPLR
jgi:hemolysin III